MFLVLAMCMSVGMTVFAATVANIGSLSEVIKGTVKKTDAVQIASIDITISAVTDAAKQFFALRFFDLDNRTDDTSSSGNPYGCVYFRAGSIYIHANADGWYDWAPSNNGTKTTATYIPGETFNLTGRLHLGEGTTGYGNIDWYKTETIFAPRRTAPVQ